MKFRFSRNRSKNFIERVYYGSFSCWNSSDIPIKIESHVTRIFIVYISCFMWCSDSAAHYQKLKNQKFEFRQFLVEVSVHPEINDDWWLLYVYPPASLVYMEYIELRVWVDSGGALSRSAGCFRRFSTIFGDFVPHFLPKTYVPWMVSICEVLGSPGRLITTMNGLCMLSFKYLERLWKLKTPLPTFPNIGFLHGCVFFRVFAHGTGLLSGFSPLKNSRALQKQPFHASRRNRLSFDLRGWRRQQCSFAVKTPLRALWWT